MTVEDMLQAPDEFVGPACINVPVPKTIAMEFEFREPYAQGYRHAIADVRKALKEPLRLSFDRLIQANTSRVERWHGLHDWSPLEWAGAMCGEAGEASNFAKKLKRLQTGIANIDGRIGGREYKSETLRQKYAHSVGCEVGDTIIYGLLLCAAVGVDPIECIREVFNEKSKEYGFPERI